MNSVGLTRKGNPYWLHQSLYSGRGGPFNVRFSRRDEGSVSSGQVFDLTGFGDFFLAGGLGVDLRGIVWLLL